MAMEPAAISASPATTTMWLLSTAPERPAASAKGTVSPSDIPITTSRTTSPAVKCRSMCGVCGIVFQVWMFAYICQRSLCHLALALVAESLWRFVERNPKSFFYFHAHLRRDVVELAGAIQQ